MSESIPYATPYPWDNQAVVESQRLANQKLRKRRFVGTGLASLQENAFGEVSRMTASAQGLLRGLLHEHGIEAEVDNDTSAEVYRYESVAVEPDTTSKVAAEVNANEAETQKLATAGKFSLFLTILSIISDSAPGPVPTKTLFKSCCLAVRPGDVPGAMDAKEMVMASLQFLSQDCATSSNELVSLPLIRPNQELADLERRTYYKDGDWSLTDTELRKRILRLEQFFVSSSSSFRWLKREYFSPRLSVKEETSFFLKGNIPAAAAGKKPTKEPASRKRNMTVAICPFWTSF